MTVNSARFEESSEIVIDQQVEAPSAGWTINYASVNRVGSSVVLHVEATNAPGAAAPVLTLQADFAPGGDITDGTGAFTLSTAGVLAFTGSTVGGAKHVCQLVYQAGQSSP